MKIVAVLDDDPILVDLYSTILSEEGYGVKPIDVLNKPDTVVESIRQARANLLILDMFVPGLDIFSLVQDLQSEPELKIMLCSAARRQMENLQQKLGAINIPMPATLNKPFDIEEFVQLIEQLIGPN